METFTKVNVYEFIDMTDMDMNDIRDIILQWEKGFDTEEEKMFFYLRYSKILNEEYWDMMPMHGSIREHPWDKYDD